MQCVLTKSVAAGALVAAMLAAAPAIATESDDAGLFIVRQLEQPPQEASALVRNYAQMNDDWLFLAEFGLAGGQVTALKICYPEIGPDIVAAGMHAMAMMPCGHFAFYEEDGQSMMSMLDLSFMTTLDPHPALEDARATASPAFAAMLADVLGVDIGS